MKESPFTQVTIPVHVGDFEQGVEFYTGLLGCAPDEIPDYGVADWELFPKCRIHVYSNPGPATSFSLDVPEVRVFYERVRAKLGVEPRGDQYKYDWSFCSYQDPWGNEINVYKSRRS